MIGTSFNDGWTFGSKANFFDELTGGREESTPVTLPHDAMLTSGRDPSATKAGPIGHFRTGAYEYTKTFIAPEEWRDHAVVLRFEGIYRQARVHLDGELVAERPSGYAEVLVDLTGLVRLGEDNVLRVQAHTGDDSRWYPGGGIYRNTTLLVGGPVHVVPDGVRVSTPDVDSDRALVAVATELRNRDLRPRTVRIRTELFRGDALVASEESPITLQAGSGDVLRQRLVVPSPARWSPDDPQLHVCRTTVIDGDHELDASTVTFGIRTIQIDPSFGFRINGERVDLRGACIHHDNGVLGAATITRADERRVEILRSAGFNAIRSAHNPMSRALLDACDRLGMLVMDELADAWTVTKRDQDGALHFDEWWERDLESMVAKDFNHPSVVMYSTGNEIPEVTTTTGARMSRTLTRRLHELDGTRFVTNGVNGVLALGEELGQVVAATTPSGFAEAAGVNTVIGTFTDMLGPAFRSDRMSERLEEAAATLDVVGYNYLDARYEVDRVRHPGRVIVGSETSAISIAELWPYIRANSHVVGDFTWTGWDYLGEAGIGRVERTTDGERTLEAPYPWLLASCGDIDITGHRLPASYFREIVFGLRTDPYPVVQPIGSPPISHSSPWSWSDAVPSWTWPGHEGEPATIELYADADEVEVIVNGRGSGRAPAGAAHGFRAEIETTYEPGELTVVAFREGAEVGRSTLRTATDDLRLSVTADRSTLTADHHDLSFISIELADGDGVVHPARDRTVDVVVDGPAVLQGLGSADPCNEEGFLATSHMTYRGRALAVVRPTGPGTITVTVSATDCDDATVTVVATAPFRHDNPSGTPT